MIFNGFPLSLIKIYSFLIQSIPGLIALILVIATCVKVFYKRKFSYWSDRGVPGPKPQIFFGTMLKSFKLGMMAHTHWVKEYGTIYGIYMRSTPILVVAHVECVKDILISNFNKFTDRPVLASQPLDYESLINQNGAQWKIDRSVMSPAFSSGKIKAMFSLMKDSYQHLDRELARLAKLDDEIDVKGVFSKLTTMVIARCAFATEVDAFKDQNNELLNKLHQIFKSNIFSRLKILVLLILPKFVRDSIGFSFIPSSSLFYLEKVCKKILHERKSNPSASNTYPDFLQLLMDSNKTPEVNANTDDETVAKSKGFSDMKIIANAILFFIAGYETTSTLLYWASYALVMNPDVQEKLYEEVKRVKQSSGDLDYESLSTIKYLDAFISETLRMYPPVSRIMRQCTQDHTLPNGLVVEKGRSIVIPIYSIQHDENNYPAPEKFDPERFMPENKSKIERAAFLPFVEGPRNCIGMRFALVEAKLALANLILKYKFVKSCHTPEKIEFDRHSFILTAKQMTLKIQVRTD